MIRRTIILIIPLLGGCVAIKPYESVDTGPRAKVTITKISSMSASIPEEKHTSAQMDVVIFEPDEHCKFQYRGGVKLERGERTRTIFVPAGRRYFRVHVTQLMGYMSPPIQDVSFVLDDNQEYLIEYQGKDRKGSEMLYEIKYLQTLGTRAKSVEVDQFSICKREKGIASN
jgi:hypothetical protein